MAATVMRASATRVIRSRSRSRRRHFMIQAKVRSTPSAADHDEAFHAGGTTDDFERDMGRVPRPADQLSGVAAVGEDLLHEREGAAGSLQDAAGAVAVLDAGGQQAAVGVGRDAALASVDAFSRITAFESPF